ncbi:hypothetical protein GCM10008922_42070 [Faecalicatena contorta]|jgi:hypothetical protein
MNTDRLQEFDLWLKGHGYGVKEEIKLYIFLQDLDEERKI